MRSCTFFLLLSEFWTSYIGISVVNLYNGRNIHGILNITWKRQGELVYIQQAFDKVVHHFSDNLVYRLQELMKGKEPGDGSYKKYIRGIRELLSFWNADRQIERSN